MTSKSRPVSFIMFLFSILGFWQFSDGVRAVDVVGLFASGALTGAAITAFIAMRNKN